MPIITRKLPDSEVFDRDYINIPKETEDDIADRLEKIMIRQRAARDALKEPDVLEEKI